MMADGLEEEMIIIEDSDAAYESAASKSSVIDEESSSATKKKLILIGIGVGLVLTISLLFLIIQKQSKRPADSSMGYIDERLEKPISKPVEPSKIESMIAKADYLYSTGSKTEALTLYEKIAHYSEAVSAYNLGVAQLKDAQYKIALETFQKAIQNI